jgi:hypothetical protein
MYIEALYENEEGNLFLGCLFRKEQKYFKREFSLFFIKSKTQRKEKQDEHHEKGT